MIRFDRHRGDRQRGERVRNRCGERGQAAGVETVALGFLVVIGATLLAVNVWAAIDARSTLDNAARDYLRAYTAEATRAEAAAAGLAAFQRSVGSRWPDNPTSVAPPPEPFGPCRPATVTASLELSAFRVPFVGVLGAQTIRATQTELVQPYGAAVDERPGLPASACDG